MIKYNEFIGPFKDLIPNYIQYKRSLGYKFDGDCIYRLREMDSTFKSLGINESIITKEMSDEYTKKRDNEKLTNQGRREVTIRQFGLYLKQNGYDNIYICKTNKKTTTIKFVPYIFSKKEIKEILYMADNLENSKYNRYHKRYKEIYPALIRTLYSLGLRISECLSLQTKDIDFTNAIITIHDSKNKVSRLVPMSNSLNQYLLDYKTKLNLSEEDYFFSYEKNKKMSKHSVGYRFQFILKEAKIQRRSDDQGPRLHDLRHSFCVHTLENMINNKEDIYTALPILSTFLGHKNVTSTEYYLRLTKYNYDDLVSKTEHIYDDIYTGVDSDE